MPASMKDKRTKEQILKLLDRAIEQEERLAEKIKTLENELADCRKKAEDPRHELTEEAMPASKVAFRIDYYRTSEGGPLKGIIEHLPSRQNKPFEGEGQLVISHFMSRFLTEESGGGKQSKTLIEEKIEAPVVSKEDKKEKKVIAEITPRQEEPSTIGSQMLKRLRAEFEVQSQATLPETTEQQRQPSSPPKSARLERILSKTKATTPPPVEPGASDEGTIATHTPERRSRLLERILEEHRKNLKP